MKSTEVKHIFKKPLKAFVEEKYLYNLDDEGHKKLIPCLIISVCSYKGHRITIEILLDNGSQFCYLPLESIRFCNEENQNYFSYHANFANFICPSKYFIVTQVPIFKERKAHLFDNKTREFIGVAEEYICSLDWYKDNDLLHLVKFKHNLLNINNHKVLWLKKIDLNAKIENYKALKYQWK
jgi:hypothetical protein